MLVWDRIKLVGHSGLLEIDLLVGTEGKIIKIIMLDLPRKKCNR
jgi:hypothetical protein